MGRRITFAVGEYYHVYNRGVMKSDIFKDKLDVERFLFCIELFNNVAPVGSVYEQSFRKDGIERPEKLVDMVAYCLNPNHYHFLLKENVEGGVSEFIKRLAGGYTGYFNNRYDRSGVLFQGKFKAVHIATNESLLNVSAYVSLNDRIHALGGRTAKLVRSSWGEYTGDGEGLCSKGIVLDQFKSMHEYSKFALSTAKILQKNKEMKKRLLTTMFE